MNNTFLLNLLNNKSVDTDKIFVIPISGFVSGIWLIPDKHKSNRVDFWNFHENYGCERPNPKPIKGTEHIIQELNDNRVITDAQMKTLIEMGLDNTSGISSTLYKDETIGRII